jgi:general secretion pathway protein C
MVVSTASVTKGVFMRRHIILLGYLTFAAFLLAHLINTLLAEAISSQPTALPGKRTPVALAPIPQADHSKMAEEILSSGLFGPGPAAVDSSSPGAPAAGGKAIERGLDAAKKIKLSGIVMTEGLIPFAVIEDLATKRQTLYRLFETIPDVGSIAQIRADAILLEQDGIHELLELNPGRADPAPAAKTAMANAPGTPRSLHRVLDQREVARSMADLPKLLSQARVGPVYAHGKVEGWKVEGITPQSFYDRIGLQAGDVLQRVNGVEIRDPAMILGLLQLLKNERSVSLDMLRDSRKTTMLFEIR